MIEKIIEFESGELSPDEVTELFQELVSTGLINHLQGSYQRFAAHLVDTGVISL